MKYLPTTSPPLTYLAIMRASETRAVKARTHDATLRATCFTMKFVARNISEVERDSTAAILQVILRAGVDTQGWTHYAI